MAVKAIEASIENMLKEAGTLPGYIHFETGDLTRFLKELPG